MEKGEEKMTKGKVSLAQSENVSRHVHQRKSILQVSEERRILSKKHRLLQFGISSFRALKEDLAYAENKYGSSNHC